MHRQLARGWRGGLGQTGLGFFLPRKSVRGSWLHQKPWEGRRDLSNSQNICIRQFAFDFSDMQTHEVLLVTEAL